MTHTDKTKEELLRRIVPNNCYFEENFDNVPRHYILRAMEEYAAIKSEELLEALKMIIWTSENACPESERASAFINAKAAIDKAKL